MKNKSRKSKKASSHDEDGEREKLPGKISPHDGDNRPKANGPTDLEPGEIGDPVRETTPVTEIRKDSVKIREDKNNHSAGTDIGPDEVYNRRRHSRSRSEEDHEKGYQKDNWHKQKFSNRRIPMKRSPESPRTYNKRLDFEFRNNRNQKYNSHFYKSDLGKSRIQDDTRKQLYQYTKPYKTPDLWNDKYLRLNNRKLLATGGEPLLRHAINADYDYTQSCQGQDEQKLICKTYRFTKCKKDECFKRHPEECEKYKKEGPKGCEYYNCGQYHKAICAISYDGQDCHKPMCPFLHYGTKRIIKTNEVNASTIIDANENIVITDCPRHGCICYEMKTVLEKKLMHLFFDASVIIKASKLNVFQKNRLSIPAMKSCSRFNCPCDQMSNMDLTKFHNNYDNATTKTGLANISWLLEQEWFNVEIIGMKDNSKSNEMNSQFMLTLSKKEEDELLS